jgi:AAA+ superfamily predicted ATPase
MAWMLGRRGLAAELSATAHLIAAEADERGPGTAMHDLAQGHGGDPEHDHRLAQLAKSLTAGHQLVVLQGAVGAGRELLLRAAARALNRPLLLVRARGLDPGLVVAAFRDAILHGALLAFAEADELFASDGHVRLRECLGLYAGTVVVMGLGAHLPALAAVRATIEIAIPLPPYARRLALWRSHLGPADLIDEQWRELSGLYNLGVGGITRASAVARQLAASDGRPVDRAHVAQAIRQLFEADLSAVATRVEVSQTWDDVVLPPEVVESIIGIVDRVALRNEVLGDWGFGRKVGKGLGVTVLFSGQPGTGKSMVAGLIARELGLDLYVIDLSRITSKWIGETEKNLGRAFDAAEAGHVLLLFDEADSILGKRTTEVRSSNDRHANLETNFILARLEQFHGIAIFTTNIASAIDPAILRRMSANIMFPFPDLESRAELWRKMIPAEAPVSGTIDFLALAQQFELTGGFIRNVVLRAAFLAAREGRPIHTSHLERSARGEYGDRGALTVGGRLT